MRRFGEHACGAVILNSEWALSAAHCTDSGSANNYEVVAGEHKRSTPTASFQKVGVLQIKNHESYSSPLSMSNDISLLRLASRLSFNENVTPACSPRSVDYSGETVTVSGWGTDASMRKNGTGDPLTDELRYANVKTLSHEACRNFYPGEVDDSMICSAAPGRDTCQGDSGGPMAFNNNGRFEVIGLTSWGKGCAEPENPGVYANVYNLLEWIRENSQ